MVTGIVGAAGAASVNGEEKTEVGWGKILTHQNFAASKRAKIPSRIIFPHPLYRETEVLSGWRASQSVRRLLHQFDQ
jgi:hypothetical protein